LEEAKTLKRIQMYSRHEETNLLNTIK
jgi:hypothetical protein